jgi:hypothetical protein
LKNDFARHDFALPSAQDRSADSGKRSAAFQSAWVRAGRILESKLSVGTTDFTDDTDEEAAGPPGSAFSTSAKISED